MYNKSLRKFWFVCVVGGYLLFGVPSLFAAQPVDPGNLGKGQPWAANDKKNEPKAKYAPGRFIVKFKSEGPNAVTGDAQSLLESNQPFQASVADGLDSLDKLNQKHKVKNARSLFVERSGLTTADATRKQNNGLRSSMAMHQSRSQRAPKDAVIPDLSNIYVLEVAPESNIETIVQEYQADPHVEYAQPDYVMETYMVPNDPYYSSSGSWGQTYDDLWGLKNIKAEQAWDITQGDGVVVAVVDTGLDYNHPDIAANVWTNPGEIPNNGMDDDANGLIDDIRGWDFANMDNDPMDGCGHGTHVSGTIAAVGNNNLGIIGVAPKAKIMSLKGLSDTGSGYIADLAKGIVYAAQNGADVINNSWGCGGGCPSNPVAEDAVRTAYNLGAVVVFAAGNNTDDVSNYSPQNMSNPKPIVVAAVDHFDHGSDFSNFGRLIDVVAPGGDSYDGSSNVIYRNILSLRARYTDMQSNPAQIVGTDYYRVRGTSMAAPHAAGVAALVLAHRPAFTNEEVRQAIRTSADDLEGPGFDLYTGAGRINAVQALTVDSVLTSRITSPASGSIFRPSQGIVTITGTVAGPGLSQYQLFYGKGFLPTDWIALGPPTNTQVIDGILGTWTISAVPDNFYILRVVATSVNGYQFQDAILVVMDATNKKLNSGWYPTISGNLVAWYHSRDGITDHLYLYDLVTDTERRITPDQSSPFLPEISGSMVVWNDGRYWSEVGQDIYLYDIATDTERRITTNPADQESPTISGNRIVWLDRRDGMVDGSWRYNIYIYDLATDTERRITGPEANVSMPDSFNFKNRAGIDGDLIVWTDERNLNESDTDIYLYDLATDTEHRITTTLGPEDSQMAPAVSGNNIVWTDYRDDPYGDIAFCVYDPVTATCPAQWIANDYGVFQMHPAVSGNLVVWEDKRNGDGIYLYDLDTGLEQRLTFNPYYNIYPAISGNRVVWESNHSIFAQEVTTSPPGAPVLEPIGSKAVSGGTPLQFVIRATDPDGDRPSLTAYGLPPGARFDRVIRSEPGVVEQVFEWTPDFMQTGRHQIRFFATIEPYRDTETITITVEDIPPEIISFGDGPDPFSPNGDGDRDETTITASFNHFVHWKIRIENASGDLVRGWIVGSGTTMSFKWDGKDNWGNLVTGGTYTYEISGGDRDMVPASKSGTVTVLVPDLLLTALSKTTGPLARGGSFSVSNTVANQGNASAGAFAVGFVLSGDAVYGGTDDIIMTAARSVASLAAGATSAASTTVTVPAATAFGNYYVCAMADKDASVAESSEINNSRCTVTPVQVAPADLVVTVVSGPSTAVTGTSVTVSNTVKNQGTGKTGSFSVGFYLSTDAAITTADTRIGTRNIGSLTGGAINSVSTTLTIPTGRPAGTYYLGAIADYTNTVMESNETNNALTGNAVTLTSGTDLIMTAVSGPSVATRGTYVGITDTVKNQGVGTVTNTFLVGLYLSTDAVITTADRRVGTRTLGLLPAGGNNTEVTGVRIPDTLPAGTYYLGAIADYTNTVKENNEINNVRAGNTIVVQ